MFINSYEKLYFPPLFTTSFGPTALLYPIHTLTNPVTCGEDVGGSCTTSFSTMCLPSNSR
jgi:hypothetical protein